MFLRETFPYYLLALYAIFDAELLIFIATGRLIFIAFIATGRLI